MGDMLRNPLIAAASLSALALSLLAPSHSDAAGPDEHLTVRAIARETAVRPGTAAGIALELKYAPGLHSWPAAEVPLPKAVEATEPDRTSITVDAGAGARLVAIQ